MESADRCAIQRIGATAVDPAEASRYPASAPVSFGSVDLTISSLEGGQLGFSQSDDWIVILKVGLDLFQALHHLSYTFIA